MTKALSAIIGISLLATIPLTYIAFHHHNTSTQTNLKSKQPDPIKDGLKLYLNQAFSSYTVDDYIILSELSRVTNQVPLTTLGKLAQKYDDNPYKRLVDKNNFTQNITFTLIPDPTQKLDYYTVANIPNKLHIYDSIFLKALYCDVTGYTDEDFATLDHLDHRGSESLSNSYFFALLLLQENQCYDNHMLTAHIEDSAQRLTRTEDADNSFSDLYAQRIVLLYWSGYGNLVKKEWIEKIKENYKPGVGWTNLNNQQVSNNVTGLSLLALIYYAEGKPLQELY